MARIYVNAAGLPYDFRVKVSMTRRRNNLLVRSWLALLFTIALPQQPGAEQNSQNSQNPSPDIAGRWETEDHRQFDVVQNGQHVRATLVAGSNKCANGGTLDYLFDGDMSGALLKGTMMACTAEKLIKDCGLSQVWTTTFNATAAPDVISGDVFIEGRDTKCQLNKRYDLYQGFTVTACEDVAMSQDDAQITPEESTRVKIRVTCHQIPVPNATVQISLKVEDQSGRHDHSDSRPRGQLDGYTVPDDNPIERKTDANGKVTNGVTEGIKFDPPYKVDLSKNVGIAGIYEVTVKSKRLPKHGGTLPILVRFTNLTSLPESPDAFYEICGCSTCNTCAAGVAVRGTPKHREGEFGTPGTITAFDSVAVDFYNAQKTHNQQLLACKEKVDEPLKSSIKAKDPVKASINDIALPDGGLFDVDGNWTAQPGHKTHGKGQGGDFNHFGATGTVYDCDKDCNCSQKPFNDWLLHELLVAGQAHGTWDCNDLGLAPPCMQAGPPTVGPSAFQNAPANFPHRLHLHVEDQ